ncbi:NrdH-like glutaredoxin [Gordonia phage Daredevil]|uniref:NrdH-like glutaredoxin n=1 Tax=Gordonia phage Daredevil TaxID=2283286 RepID=A0A345MIT1_9CAUD|nr:NrdH-like glutaredoxin [Gordonia phage Daredevil]AXH70462.1 NrdH-like glutaredoxin [Gordonia phage Daredevil]
MPTSVTVYSKPDRLCVQCKATKSWLIKREIAFDVIDITEDEAALDKLKALGYLQAPVVVIADETGAQLDVWSGHKATKLEQHFKK